MIAQASVSDGFPGARLHAENHKFRRAHGHRLAHVAVHAISISLQQIARLGGQALELRTRRAVYAQRTQKAVGIERFRAKYFGPVRRDRCGDAFRAARAGRARA